MTLYLVCISKNKKSIKENRCIKNNVGQIKLERYRCYAGEKNSDFAAVE